MRNERASRIICVRAAALASLAVGLVGVVALVGLGLAPTRSSAVPAASVGGAAQPGPGEVVEVEAAVGSAPLVQGERARAAVEMRIAEGFHVNATPPTYDYLIATEIGVEAPDGVSVAAEHHPEPLHKTFPYAEEPLAVYEGTTLVGLEIAVADDAPIGDATLVLEVRYQACDDRACFAPTSVTARLPVTIAAAGTPSRPVRSELLERAPFPDQARQAGLPSEG